MIGGGVSSKDEKRAPGGKLGSGIRLKVNRGTESKTCHQSPSHDLKDRKRRQIENGDVLTLLTAAN